jgi:RNA polymerase sigma-70 factor (ECF subfamily)
MAEIPATRASLLVRLRDPRDGAAWDEFVNLYGPLLYGYARKQGLQDADAADLGQEVLTAVAGAIGRLEYDPRRGTFRNWLFTVMRRKLANWRESVANRTCGSGDAAMQWLLEQCEAPADLEAEWEAQWQRRLVAWACGEVRRQVADTTWQAFWKTSIEDLPGKQVAAELGLSVAAVYQARSRVLVRMRELVQSVQEP